MKRGKFEHPRPVKPARKGLGVKVAGLALAGLLVFGCGVGGTLAWLQAKSETVTNTFTSSDINITLTETTGDKYQMIPGHTITKDPVVTVKAGSEDCYLFIKVEKDGGEVTVGNTTYSFSDFISYEIDTANWEQLKDNDNKPVDGVYVYKGDNYKHKANNVDNEIKVLGYWETSEKFVPNKVLVKDSVTKEMMNAITDATRPTLTFTAYATQYYKTNGTPFEAYDAWLQVSVSNS